jgi:sporulation protein YlmC with PRC-barrel domain
MLDYHIAATDGVQGTVQDFLFDDESWVVHYLVAETATPLGKRMVLILPFAAGWPDWEKKRLPVQLTCEQIRTCPPLEADMPIGRQFESGLRRPGSHLRSMREVLGYSIHANTGGEVGTLEDFIVEDTLWGVHHAVVALKETPRRAILLSPEAIRSISWRGKAAWVNLSRPELERHPDFNPARPVNRDRESRLFDYYGRPIFQVPPVVAEQHGPEAGQR